MRNPLIIITAIATLLIGLRTSGNAQLVIWDTVGTGTVRLAVSNHGSMGLNGIGGANMDFTSSGLDCDPTADVYLKSGGLFIIQKIDSAAGLFGLSTGLYQNDASASYSFRPDSSGPPSSHFVGPDGSDAFFTGRFLNWDSTIGIEQTYYAPTTGTPNDKFIIIRTDVFPLDGLDHPGLAIGDVIDWDVPSDESSLNIAWISGRTVFLRGVDTASVPGCQLFSNRFAGSTFLGMYTSLELNNDLCTNDGEYYGAYASDNTVKNPEAQGSPNGVIDSALAWNIGGSLTGEWAVGFPMVMDQRINQTFVHDYTLAASDTLIVYTALATVYDGTTSNLDTFVDAACDWYESNLRPGCNVCGPDCNCGDVNGDGGQDIADVTALLDFLLGGPPPVDSACANVDGRFGITISDFVRALDVQLWWYNQFPYCDWGMDYNYLPTPDDTVFVPSMTNIPETAFRVELPIFVSYFNHLSIEGVYLPFLPLGQGSDSTFATDDPDSTDHVYYNIKPDTALHLDFQFNHPSRPVGRVLSGVIRYSRISEGVGQIVPEIVNEFDLKRMALAKLDSADNYTGDLYIPTVKTYAADPCCLAGGGNVDCDPNDNTDIADLTMLIDHLFIGFDPLCCRSEANVDVDTDVTVDMSDLTMLIDHLFISFAPIQSCQTPYLDD